MHEEYLSEIVEALNAHWPARFFSGDLVLPQAVF
jgi:hypothetical protein